MTVKKQTKNIDWNAKSDSSLRAAYAYRKKNNMQIEPELNATLAKRFPGYNPIQQKFIGQTNKKIDWDTKSDSALRGTYAYRKKNGIPISPELNATLAKRFPGYDAIQQKFIGQTKRKIDWNAKSDRSLRATYAYLKKNNIQIEPELNAILAKRFPAYDAIQQKFIAQTKRKIDWGAKSDRSLRATYAYRKKNNIQIEPELNAELARRFPGYDAVQEKFTGIKITREIDWNAKSKHTLRMIFAYRKKNNMPIEPELNEVMAKRFSGYDAVKKIFTGRNCRKPKLTPEIDWNKKPDNALRTMHAYRKKHDMPIEPELNAELARRFPGYDAVQEKFTGIKITRKIDWNAKSDNTLRMMYAYRKKHNMPIEPELNELLAKRFPGYDAAKKIFTGRGGHPKSIKKKTPDVPKKTKLVRITNWANKSDEILRRAHKQQLKTLWGVTDELNTELARRFPREYNTSNRKFIKKTKIRTYIFTHRTAAKTLPTETISTAPKPERLIVQLKPVKQSSDLTYNNVYVNGKLILRNHANTELKLFGDRTLLGAYGIIENNPDLPQYPTWILYDTNLFPNKWVGNTKWAKHNVLITNISSTPNMVYLSLNNRSVIILENEKLKHRAGISRFEIQR